MRIEELANRYYSAFTNNDKYICEVILNNKKDCIELSIDDFACKYHVSSSSLSRFAQKLKLPGYSELRAVLRLNGQKTFPGNQHVNLMMECYHQCINDIEHKECTAMFEKIKAASRIIIFGEGYAQGRVAKEMKRIFLPTGKKIYDVYGYDTIDSLLNFIGSKDVVFLISIDGEEERLLSFAKELKMKGIFMVSVTRMKSNSLSHLCDENLYIQSSRFFVNSHTEYEVTTPYFILIELLYIKYKMYCEI